jgi:hypothetical protein
MKPEIAPGRTLFAALALACLAALPQTASAAANTVLEKYSFALGTTGMAGHSPGAELRSADRFFGGGTARCRIKLLEESSAATLADRPMLLFLDVDRKIADGEIVFALLVFRIEIRGYDVNGSLVFSRDLSGFRFGDSASGRWYERLAGLPTRLTQLTLTFFGNYE